MDKQQYIKYLFERKDYWESLIIAKEHTISVLGDFFTDAELDREFEKLEVLRNNFESINNELSTLISVDTDIEK